MEAVMGAGAGEPNIMEVLEAGTGELAIMESVKGPGPEMEEVVGLLENDCAAVLPPTQESGEQKDFVLCPQPAPTLESHPGTRKADLPADELLEKLHLKYEQKPWIETMKLVRHCLERTTGSAWRGTLGFPMLHSLEKLQRSLKVRSLSTMVNRLELLSKQKGLEYHVSPTGKGCYITSDMFYVEILVRKNGDVVDVKLAHHGEAPTACEELLHLLRVKDFEAFGKNMEGLLAMYQIPGDNEVKAKVHIALQTLEKDLMGIAMLDGSSTQNANKVSAILHGKVGHLEPRKGGSPMTVEYYASPYQLLEEKLNPGAAVCGVKALVTVGSSDALHKLPIMSLLAGSQPVDSGEPEFLPLTDELCMDLPACFFLTFLQPVPIMMCLIRKMQNITGLPVYGTKVGPLYDLIIQSTHSADNSEYTFDKQHFLVTLPDSQKHCYFINNCSCKGDILMGVLVIKIPFTHPKHMPCILEVLRHQSVYNTLISSCVSKCGTSASVSEFLHFEVFPQTNTSFCVSFQNPLGCSLACVAVDVVNSQQLQCKLHVDSESLASICTNEFIVKVMECCMSIPVTMRAIFKKAPNIEVVSEMETSAENIEQFQPLNIEVIPPKAQNSPTENISQMSEFNGETLPANGLHIKICTDAHTIHELDESPQHAQPNGHYDPMVNTTEHFDEPELYLVSEPSIS
ncbi:mediator of RNA polymerase II transcription subunit 1-like [Ambystoma mexicanum]|uniref:mediator of RNA polymerase II transcription subunit 1-like n=1 Tax=Ambystoma mexicanum TaxID=8296 RepID=UPI0037E90776